jgi:cell division protein FtsX
MSEKENPVETTQAPPAQPVGLATRVRSWLHGPLLIGVVAALIAIGLSLYGMIVNKAAPLSLQSFALVILVAGGSWGLIAWAIATAAVEAGKD